MNGGCVAIFWREMRHEGYGERLVLLSGEEAPLTMPALKALGADGLKLTSE